MKNLFLWVIVSLSFLVNTTAFATPKTGSSKKPVATKTQPSTPKPVKLTPSQEVKELFDANNSRKSITINGRELQQLPNSQGLTRIFSGANDNEVKDFFSKLTGKPLPNPTKIPNKGIVYSVTGTDGKKYNLRDFASSSNVTGSAWTIDIPKGVANPTKATEIKFIR